MSNRLPSESRIRDRLRSKLHPLIVEQPALAADVVPGVLAEAMDILSEFQQEIERLEAAADLDALHAAYVKGSGDERASGRKWMPDTEVIEAIRSLTEVPALIAELDMDYLVAIRQWLDSLEAKS